MVATLFGRKSTNVSWYSRVSSYQLTAQSRRSRHALVAIWVALWGCLVVAQTPARPTAAAELKRVAVENEKRLNDCSAYPDQTTSSYVLPWKSNASHRIWRTSDHFRRGNGGVGLYAIDIEMPTGTEVVTSREGVVIAVRDNFYDGNGKEPQENYILIQHDDGTIARYLRLTHRGVLVKVGHQVAQGQVIGLSGNTGETGGPHLHFDVQQCGPNLPPNDNALPCGQTLPVTFRNTRPHACGLVPSQVYRAEKDPALQRRAP